MRRRWSWPILEVLRKTDPDDWIGAWFLWLFVGFFVLVFPALMVDHRPGHAYVGTYLLVALIVYGIPVIAGVLILVGGFVWDLLGAHGHKLIPRRVTEPVREDLRDADRRLPPDRLR